MALTVKPVVQPSDLETVRFSREVSAALSRIAEGSVLVRSVMVTVDSLVVSPATTWANHTAGVVTLERLKAGDIVTLDYSGSFEDQNNFGHTIQSQVRSMMGGVAGPSITHSGGITAAMAGGGASPYWDVPFAGSDLRVLEADATLYTVAVQHRHLVSATYTRLSSVRVMVFRGVLS